MLHDASIWRRDGVELWALHIRYGGEDGFDPVNDINFKSWAFSACLGAAGSEGDQAVHLSECGN